jgi:hypothetical protein
MIPRRRIGLPAHVVRHIADVLAGFEVLVNFQAEGWELAHRGYRTRRPPRHPPIAMEGGRLRARTEETSAAILRSTRDSTQGRLGTFRSTRDPISYS